MESFEAELAKATSPDAQELLGAVAVVIDSKGDFLYRHAAGRQLLHADSPPLDPDCAVSLASAGTFLTNIAALQLVESGVLSLDEPVRKHLPEIDACLVVEKLDGEVKERLPRRGITLRDLLMDTSGMGTIDTYQEKLGGKDKVQPLKFPDDAHSVAKDHFTHLFFDPGEGFEYGWGFYAVQTLVQRLGGKDGFLQYINDNIFAVLGMSASTYRPAQTPHVWERRLQMVKRVKEDGKASLVASDKDTYGLTCSISDLARLFSDLISPDCKILQRQEHRDLLFAPQLAVNSPAHQEFLAETTNYGFLFPLKQGESHKVSWASESPLPVNWTTAGMLVEGDVLPGTSIPKGTVAFEGQPNIIWTMNRDKGRIMIFGNQLLPGYDVKAHNIAVRFLNDAWKTFA